MTKESLFCAIGEVRDAWIADADEGTLSRVSRPRRMGRLARRL